MTAPTSLAGLAFVFAAAVGTSAEAPEADRRRAEVLAAEAEQADDREAARLLLRAARWDPGRVEDRRRAVALLDRHNRSAAVRHTVALLRDDPGFGQSNLVLLRRLKTHAASGDDPSLLGEAAALARWLAEHSRGSAPRRAAAWLEAGRLHLVTGDRPATSDAFDRLQRLVLSEPDDLSVEAYPWEAIAGLHLDAGRLERALIAIELLAGFSGQTTEVATLRARAAIAVGEPLAAIEHAREAIALAADRQEQSAASYRALADAMRKINQGDRIAATLRSYYDQRPNPRLASVLVQELVRADQLAEARSFAGETIIRLLVASAPGGRRSPVSDPPLATIAASWIELTESHDDTETVLRTLPRIIDHLGNSESLARPLDLLAAEATRRRACDAWLDKTDEAASGEAGALRARLAIGARIGRDAVAEEALRERIVRRLDAGTDLADIEAEFYAGVDELLRGAADWSPQAILVWLIDRLVDGVGARPPAARDRLLASLRVELAEAIAVSLSNENDQREASLARVARLVNEAREAAPDSAYPVYGAVRVWLACGQSRQAVEAAEELTRRHAAGDFAEPASLAWLRAAAIRAADGLLGADTSPAEVARAVELYERVLDESPDEFHALNGLAYLWAERGESLDRAERMARRAARQRPDSAACRDTLGWVLFKQGRYEQAAATLAEAIRLVDEETDDASTIRAHRAEALRALGRGEEAEAVR